MECHREHGVSWWFQIYSSFPPLVILVFHEMKIISVKVTVKSSTLSLCVLVAIAQGFHLGIDLPILISYFLSLSFPVLYQKSGWSF